MKKFMELFNNRELALAIWIIIFLFFVLMKKNIRKSLAGILKIVFKKKIFLMILSAILYIIGIILFFYLLNFWNTSLLKNTIMWFCFTGIVVLFRYVSSDEDENFFKKIIVDSIKIVIIIEFIANFYTFSFFIELILIPFLTLIVAIEMVATMDNKNESVVKISKRIWIIIGLAILIYALIELIRNYKSFLNFFTLKSFLLAPILTILFVPFIYIAVVFVKYDLLFNRLEMGAEKGKKLKSYARKKLFQNCLLSVNKLNKALNMKNYNIMVIRNKRDINEMINVLKAEK